MCRGQQSEVGISCSTDSTLLRLLGPEEVRALQDDELCHDVHGTLSMAVAYPETWLNHYLEDKTLEADTA